MRTREDRSVQRPILYGQFCNDMSIDPRRNKEGIEPHVESAHQPLQSLEVGRHERACYIGTIA